MKKPGSKKSPGGKFRRTSQRLTILEYLDGNRDHPSAEDIYRAVSKKHHSMSFATVYNTLKQFSDKETVLETEKGYRIYCENPEEVLPSVVRSLDSMGCTKTIDVEAPSLEDVFFALTEKVVSQ